MTTLMYFLDLELIAGNSMVSALSFKMYNNVRGCTDVSNDDLALIHARYYGHDRA